MMNIEEVHIKNFRALKDVTLRLSDFNCIIGANNAGKSSVLQALQSFLGMKSLPASDFYDSEKPVKITIMARITDKDLEAVVDAEQRERIGAMRRDERCKLTYLATPGQKPRLTRSGEEPKDPAWSEAAFDAAVVGKKGADLRTAVEGAFPDLKPRIAAREPPPRLQREFREVFRAHIAGLPADQLAERDDISLPTGIDASVKALYPDVIFVPAVRDAAEDVKTAGSAVFGKLIGLLLNSISGEIATFKAELAKLDEMLNVGVDDEGKPKDGRLGQVKDLEATVQKNLRESFPSVSVKLNIPPPEPKLILQGGRLELDDAVAGAVETKGDGLKRAVIFSLLRAYSELAKRPEWNPEAAPGNHILMFEEPEIFLHPTAQKLLFEALHTVSAGMQVVVTTHSPLFFSASRTNGFSKLVKVGPRVGRPFSELVSIDFDKKIDLKTQFQVLCYENHNAAFFADGVVLVEGDSDVTVLQHMARLLDPDWDFEEGRVHLVKVDGKGNFARFAEFFGHFKMRVIVVADLDCLVDGFGDIPLATGSSLPSQQIALRQKAISLCPEFQADADQTTTTWRAAGVRLRGILAKLKTGDALETEDLTTMEWMDGKLGRNRALTTTLAQNESLQNEKRLLLKQLREQGIIVWEKGSIEEYYGFAVAPDRKSEAAERFRKAITSREAVLALALDVPDGSTGHKNEFLAAFQRMFASAPGGEAPQVPTTDLDIATRGA